MHRPVQEEAQPEDMAQSIIVVYCKQQQLENSISAGELTCNVDINKPIASTATYCPASLAVRKGVMT